MLRKCSQGFTLALKTFATTHAQNRREYNSLYNNFEMMHSMLTTNARRIIYKRQIE